MIGKEGFDDSIARILELPRKPHVTAEYGKFVISAVQFIGGESPMEWANLWCEV